MTDERLEKMLLSDHDALNTLIETAKNNHDNLSEKLTDLRMAVEKNNDGLLAEVRDHERRLRVVEQKQHDADTRAILLRTISGVAGGIAVFILTQIPNFLKALGILR